MIRHIVMWKVGEAAEGTSKDQNIARMKEVLSGLSEQLPFIREFSVMENNCPSDRNMDIVMITSFDSLADLDRYIVHPAHRKVADFIASVVESRSAIDYEY